MILSEKLVQLRKIKDVTQEDVSNYLNITRPAYTAYELGKRQPDYETLVKIANYFNASTDFLLGRINKLYHPLPLLGTIKAGLPILAEDNWEEQIEVPSHLKADFCLRVEGDSMLFAGIQPGDIAVFQQANMSSHGQIVAAGLEEDAWRANLKFYIRQNGQAYLRSANPDYKDIEFTAGHRIIGILVGVMKNPPSIMDYQNMLKVKEYQDKQWVEIIEEAVANGITPEQLKKLVEFHAAMAKGR